MGNLKEFEMQMTKAAFQLMVIEAIAFMIAMWVLYIVIKYAIRDGINESRLGSDWKRTAARAKARTHNGNTLPPMHVD